MTRITEIRPRTRALIGAAVLAVLMAAVLVGPQGGSARKPLAKPGASLFGVVLQGYSETIDAPALAQANPDSVRTVLAQSLIQTGQGTCTALGGACNWGSIDLEVKGAAQAGAQTLPFMYGMSNKPPVSGAAAASWNQFLTAAAQRYGPGGVFWQQNPGIPQKPIKVWQIWNEPGSPTYYSRPNVRQYAKLLKTSGATIHKVNRSAKIMLGGLFSSADRGAIRGRIPAVQYLTRLYKVRGAKNLFDIVALHPYARAGNDVINQIKQIRAVMKKNGDARKPLAITELGWSSNKKAGSLLAKGSQRGQANALRSAFKKLLAGRRKYKLDTVSWFALRDAPADQSSCPNCPFAGLLEANGTPKQAWNAFLSFTR